MICKFSIFVLFFAFSTSVFAQKPTPKTTSEENINPVCTQDLARSMAEQMISESQILPESNQRIKILLRTSEFLWGFAPDISRQNFQKAFDTARDRFKEKGTESKNTNSGTAVVGINQPDLRGEVIRAVAKRDALLAKKMSETLLKDAENPESGRSERDKDSESKIFQTLATDLAKTDPEAALNYARRSIATGSAQNSAFLLYRLAGENQSVSDRLYPEVLQISNGKTIQDFLFLSMYPFASARPFGVDKLSWSLNLPARLTPNANFQSQFLQIFVSRVESMEAELPPEKSWLPPDTVYAFSALNDFEPIVRERFPDLLERLIAARARVQNLLSEESRKKLDETQKQSETSEKTFAEKIKKLEENEATGKLKDSDIINLIFRAEKEEELKQLESWLIKLGEEVRENTVNFFWFKRGKAAVKDKRLDDAQKFADKVPEIEHRAVLYFDIAEAKLTETKDKFQAAQILNEVVKVANKAEDSVEKAQVQLGTAFLFTKLDRYRALELAGDAVKTANKLENPDLFSSSVYQKIVKKNEFAFVTVYNTPGFDLEKTFGKIAEKDLDNILSISRNFNDRYIRTVAVLAVVKNCRESEKSPKPKAKPNTVKL